MNGLGWTDYLYPAVWWTVLTLADLWNRRRGLRLYNAHFIAVTVPVSVLFWLFFEILNLISPQWRYVGGIRSLTGQIFFGFIAFATVIPITVEAWWLVAGEIFVPFRAQKWPVSLLFGAIFVSIPFFNRVFWWNQGMWLAPAMLMLPWAPFRRRESWGRWLAALTVSGLLSGVAWETFNWWSRTHWEYLILPDWPHLFQMPLLGYLGFIPFTFSAHAAFELQRRIPARPLVCALLYGAAFAGLAVLTVQYRNVGLWRTVP